MIGRRLAPDEDDGKVTTGVVPPDKKPHDYLCFRRSRQVRDLANDKGAGKNFRLKAVMLILIVSGSTGAAAVVGSVLGAAVNHAGLFIGALFGGLIGVWVAVRLSKAPRIIEANEVCPGILGGGIGFFLAAPLAAANAHTPIIPVLSVGLAGLGALVSVKVSGKLGSR